MKLRTLVCGFVCGALTMMLTASGASMLTTGESDDATRQALKQAGQRGKAHKALKHINGQYMHKIKWWGNAGATPIEAEARAETTWLVNSGVFMQKLSVTWMDIPFKAVVMVGYDNLAEQYTAVWMDSLASRTIFSTGKLDGDGKTIILHGEYVDAISHQPVKVRTVFEPPTRGSKGKLEMFRTNTGDDEYKFLEVASEKRIPRAG